MRQLLENVVEPAQDQMQVQPIIQRPHWENGIRRNRQTFRLTRSRRIIYRRAYNKSQMGRATGGAVNADGWFQNPTKSNRRKGEP